MKILDDIYCNYANIEYDLKMLIHIMDIIEDYYDEQDYEEEAKGVIHIIKSNIEAGQKELQKNNARLDEFILKN